MKHLSISSLAIMLLCTGCVTDTHLAKPSIAIPQQWSRDLITQSGNVTFGETSGPVQWWRTFKDPVLDELIDQALKSGLDLKIAEARIKEARAQRSVVISDFFPHADIQAGATRAQIDAHMEPLSLNARADMQTAGLGASWELDFFGRTHQMDRAARSVVAAREEDYRAAGLAIVAEVSRNYFEFRGAQARVSTLEKILQTQEETLGIVNERNTAGTAAPVEVSLSQGLYNATAAKLPDARTAIQETTSSLAVLLVEPADIVRNRLESTEAFPNEAFPAVVGIPSQVLRDRPDVCSAERLVESAAAASGVAVADLLPRVTLTGQDASLHLVPTGLDAIGARYWTLGPSVHWPILDIGRLLGNIHVQRARHEQALRTYEKSVLAAIKDVEDAVVIYREAQNRRGILNKAVVNYEDALNSAQELYKAGVRDYLYVLEAQQMYLSSKEGKTAADTGVALSLTRLYKALGGSWIDTTNVDSTVQGSSHAEQKKDKTLRD